MLVSKIPAGVLRAFGNNGSRRAHRDKLRSPIEINAPPLFALLRDDKLILKRVLGRGGNGS